MRETPRAWVPLVFVAVALVLLLGTPLVVSRRVRKLREDLTDVADQARLLVSDFEASFAMELVLSPSGPGAPATDDSSRAAAIARERNDERELNSFVARLGPEAIERLVQLRSAEQRWRATTASEKRLSGAAARDAWSEGGRDVIAAADSLHRHLLAVWTDGRERVRRLERVDVAVAVALTPIALIALGIVVTLENRVRRFAAEADDRAAKLARSVEVRAALIHGVVHDIKNPLGAASGYADLLGDGFAGSTNDQQSEMIRRIKRLVGTAQSTASELVDLARVDAGEYPIERRETNLAATMREIVDDYQARATQKGISLTLETPSDVVPAITDPLRVRHIVENLLSNALKYTPSKGAIRVVMTVDQSDEGPRMARIAVADTGPGIPEELRDRIFEAFFRIPSSEKVAPGSGLGLAISRRIARLLGGDLTVAASDGGGSVFTLVLPIDSASSEG
jgi:signal transduction histidine kinase